MKSSSPYRIMEALNDGSTSVIKYDDATRDIDVLHDLLVLVENIVQGKALVTTKNTDDVLEYKIHASAIHPTVLVLYEKNREHFKTRDLSFQSSVLPYIKAEAKTDGCAKQDPYASPFSIKQEPYFHFPSDYGEENIPLPPPPPLNIMPHPHYVAVSSPLCNPSDSITPSAVESKCPLSKQTAFIPPKIPSEGVSSSLPQQTTFTSSNTLRGKANRPQTPFISPKSQSEKIARYNNINIGCGKMLTNRNKLKGQSKDQVQKPETGYVSRKRTGRGRHKLKRDKGDLNSNINLVCASLRKILPKVTQPDPLSYTNKDQNTFHEYFPPNPPMPKPAQENSTPTSAPDTTNMNNEDCASPSRTLSKPTEPSTSSEAGKMQPNSAQESSSSSNSKAILEKLEKQRREKIELDNNINVVCASMRRILPKLTDTNVLNDFVQLQEKFTIPAKRTEPAKPKQKTPLSCTFCGKTFQRINNLRTHERTHVVFKPYSCRICSKSFTHIRSKIRCEGFHKGERVYPCSYCCRAFSYLHCKTNHEKTHLGKKAIRIATAIGPRLLLPKPTFELTDGSKTLLATNDPIVVPQNQ